MGSTVSLFTECCSNSRLPWIRTAEKLAQRSLIRTQTTSGDGFSSALNWMEGSLRGKKAVRDHWFAYTTVAAKCATLKSCYLPAPVKSSDSVQCYIKISISCFYRLSLFYVLGGNIFASYITKFSLVNMASLGLKQLNNWSQNWQLRAYLWLYFWSLVYCFYIEHKITLFVFPHPCCRLMKTLPISFVVWQAEEGELLLTEERLLTELLPSFISSRNKSCKSSVTELVH